MRKAELAKVLVKKPRELMELTFVKRYRDPEFLTNKKWKVVCFDKTQILHLFMFYHCTLQCPYPSKLLTYCHLCPAFKALGQLMDPKEVSNFKGHVIKPNSHPAADANKEVQCNFCQKTYKK